MTPEEKEKWRWRFAGQLMAGYIAGLYADTNNSGFTVQGKGRNGGIRTCVINVGVGHDHR